MLLYGHNVEFVKEIGKNLWVEVRQWVVVTAGCTTWLLKNMSNLKLEILSFKASNVSMYTFCNSLKK